VDKEELHISNLHVILIWCLYEGGWDEWDM
jgi:hypothetical protein